MNNRKVLLIVILCFISISVNAGFSSFFKKIKKEAKRVEKKMKSDDKKDTSAAEPEQKAQKRKGFLGLGQKFGLDDKTLNIIDASSGFIKSRNEISVEEEKKIGGSLAIETVNRFNGEFINNSLKEYINLIGKTIVQFSDRPELDYHFLILDSENINAFACPGGYIFLTRGLIYSLDSESQLAGVLAHEIAHVTQKHILKTLQRGKMLSNLTKLYAITNNKDTAKYDKIMNKVNDLLFEHGIDKNMEYEADALGVEFAQRAGYNPGGLLEFIEILNKNHKTKKSVFYSTHPSMKSRIEKIKNLVLPKYIPGGRNLRERFNFYVRQR